VRRPVGLRAGRPMRPVSALAMALMTAFVTVACAPTQSSEAEAVLQAGPVDPAPPEPAPASPVPEAPPSAPPPPPPPVVTTALGQDLEVWSDMAPGLACVGELVQGGLLVCRTKPLASVFVIGGHKPDNSPEQVTQADALGWVAIGLDRDAPKQLSIRLVTDQASVRVEREIARRSFSSSEIKGLPPRTVTPAPEDQERIARERDLLNKAFESRAERADFTSAFKWPLERITVTSPWGAQRILNGTAQRPHFGVDLRGPSGTPVFAPAAGVVIVAEPDLHFAGGQVSIDHGQGLITSYLHMSALHVAVGDTVNPGTRIGDTGMKGRATGPHLCWRMKWRDRDIDPSRLPRYQAPPAPPPIAPPAH